MIISHVTVKHPVYKNNAFELFEHLKAAMRDYYLKLKHPSWKNNIEEKGLALISPFFRNSLLKI